MMHDYNKATSVAEETISQITEAAQRWPHSLLTNHDTQSATIYTMLDV